jgi:GSPII_E N-terminal domain.
MLLAANLIDEVQMRIALAEQAQSGRKFGSTLVDLTFIDENVLAAFLSKQIDIPCISLLHVDVPRKVLRKITGSVARHCQAIPIRMDGPSLEIAMVDPTDAELVKTLETASGMTISRLIAPQSSIAKMIDHFYPEEMGDDTAVAATTPGTISNDPIFSDLIQEIEDGDFEARLERIEESLEHIWVLLEKILRIVEVRDPAGQRLQSQR